MDDHQDHASPRWLTDDEQRAWRQLVALTLRLPAALEAQLQRDFGISHFEYWVVALLSEADERTMRLSRLAALANSSLSRLSHVVTRLERRGWVVRCSDPEDGRATLATLTDAGYDAVVAAAPGHVETVRTLVFDALGSSDDLATLERLCAAIVARIDPSAPPMAP